MLPIHPLTISWHSKEEATVLLNSPMGCDIELCIISILISHPLIMDDLTQGLHADVEQKQIKYWTPWKPRQQGWKARPLAPYRCQLGVPKWCLFALRFLLRQENKLHYFYHLLFFNLNTSPWSSTIKYEIQWKTWVTTAIVWKLKIMNEVVLSDLFNDFYWPTLGL